MKLAYGDPLFEAWLQRPLLNIAEGANGHCQTNARSVYHQRAYDWLASVFNA